MTIPELLELEWAYSATIKYMDIFEVTFLFDVIRNDNSSDADMAAIRVLETSRPVKEIKIASDRMGMGTKIHPLMKSIYFDYEWGNLNENLSKIEG